MPYGYDYGNPFGDPNKFTRSTQESELARFNDWMRSQPWWQQIRGNSTGDFSDQQAAALINTLHAQGITVPSAFHIDEGGNFNQKSRLKRNLIIAGGIAAAAVTGGAALGAFGAAGATAGGVGAGAGAAGAGTAAGVTAGVGAGVGASTAATVAGASLLPRILGTAVPAAMSIYANHQQSAASDRAMTVQERATQAALDFEKERDARDAALAAQELARKNALEDQDRQIAADQRAYTLQQAAERRARLDPYVNFGQQGMNLLSGLLTPSTVPRATRQIAGPLSANVAPPAATAPPRTSLASLAGPAPAAMAPPAAPPTGGQGLASLAGTPPPPPPPGAMPPGFADTAKAQGIPLTQLLDPRDPRLNRYGAPATNR